MGAVTETYAPGIVYTFPVFYKLFGAKVVATVRCHRHYIGGAIAEEDARMGQCNLGHVVCKVAHAVCHGLVFGSDAATCGIIISSKVCIDEPSLSCPYNT